MGYTRYSLPDLLKGSFTDEPVLVEGIPRGVNADNRGNDDVWGYLQEGGLFLHFNGRPLNSGIVGSYVALLRSASEIGQAVSFRGLYSTKNIPGTPGSLIVHHAAFSNVGLEFDHPTSPEFFNKR